MAITRQVPRLFVATSTGIVTASSGQNYQLGFRPRLIQIENLGGAPIYLGFGSTGVATTSGLMISTGATGSVFYAQLGLENGPPAISGFEIFSVACTSTSTSGVNIWALG